MHLQSASLLHCSFCHANWAHLSSNLFGLYVFGSSVENDEGGVAVWLTYITCALGTLRALHQSHHTWLLLLYRWLPRAPQGMSSFENDVQAPASLPTSYCHGTQFPLAHLG